MKVQSRTPCNYFNTFGFFCLATEILYMTDNKTFLRRSVLSLRDYRENTSFVLRPFVFIFLQFSEPILAYLTL